MQPFLANARARNLSIIYLHFSGHFAKRFTEIVHQKLIENSFLLFNVRERSILAVRIANFGPLREPIRMLLSSYLSYRKNIKQCFADSIVDPLKVQETNWAALFMFFIIIIIIIII